MFKTFLIFSLFSPPMIAADSISNIQELSRTIKNDFKREYSRTRCKMVGVSKEGFKILFSKSAKVPNNRDSSDDKSCSPRVIFEKALSSDQNDLKSTIKTYSCGQESTYSYLEISSKSLFPNLIETSYSFDPKSNLRILLGSSDNDGYSIKLNKERYKYLYLDCEKI